MNTYKGILVVFDGIDGAGKTTQARRLADDLISIGETVLLSKEPTDGPYGAKLRESALSGRLPFDEELELFVLDRQEHLKEKVVPALEAGQIVILDRYFYSTLAYQGLRAGTLKEIEGRIRTNIIAPDLTLWIETPPTLAVHRIEKRDGAANHFERVEDLIKIDHLFREISLDEEDFISIDGSCSIDEVYKSVLRQFIDGPLKAKRCGKSYGCDDPICCTLRYTENCNWWSLAQALNTRSGISK